MKAFKIDLSMKNELLNLYKKLSTFPEVKEVLNNLKKKKFYLALESLLSTSSQLTTFHQAAM